MEHLIKNATTPFGSVLATAWPEFVDCPARLRTLGPFLQRHLTQHRKDLILDAAMGIGCESLYLTAEGYNIQSNEIDESLIAVARATAADKDITLSILSEDWRELDSWTHLQAFSAILLLGNSLCLLPDKRDIRRSLAAFYSCLQPGGRLLIDERNFPYIMSHRKEILDGHFRFSGQYMYCGRTITGRPIAIGDQRVDFGYFRDDRLLGTLSMIPFAAGELAQMLQSAGFRSVDCYSDFSKGYSAEADFFTYVAVK